MASTFLLDVYTYSCVISDQFLSKPKIKTRCCAGVIRSSAEAIQLHVGAVRGSKHNETIVESQETGEVTQFSNEERQAYRESRF